MSPIQWSFEPVKEACQYNAATLAKGCRSNVSRNLQKNEETNK
jgi:hypothetical protein